MGESVYTPKQKNRAIRKYRNEIDSHLKETKEQPVSIYHFMQEEEVCADERNTVVAEIPIPPAIQKIIIEVGKFERSLAILRECGLGEKPFTKSLDLKREIFEDLVTAWVGCVLERFPLLKQRLTGCSWRACVGKDWEMLFVERLSILRLEKKI